jgi:hypothetical protein
MDLITERTCAIKLYFAPMWSYKQTSYIFEEFIL